MPSSLIHPERGNTSEAKSIIRKRSCLSGEIPHFAHVESILVHFLRQSVGCGGASNVGDG